MKKYIRKTAQTSDILPLACLITFVVILLGQGIGDVIVGFFMSPDLETTNPALAIGLSYLSFIGIWIALALFMLFPKNRPMIKGLYGNDRGNNLKGIIIGILIGFGMNGFCALMSILLKDIGVSLWYVEPLKLILLFLCVFVQSGAEELVCRWYLYQKLARRYKNPLVACIGNAVLFGLLHIFNPGLNVWSMVQIIVIGLLLSVMVYYYDSLWGAMLVHTAWNFTQNLIFGLPNSGIVSPYSLFHLDAASSGFFFDPGFGIEGSPGACLVITIVMVVMIVIARKKNLQPVDLWAEEEAALEAQETASAQA
jgi:membrane protease YdiL (CAAX protease family)